MRITVERISNGLAPNINKSRSITADADKLAKDILSELKEKGEAVKSLARMGGDNRKGVIIVGLPESVRNEVRRNFDLSQEPSEFVIQCKSGKNTEGEDVILVTVGFTTGSQVTDALENWLIEAPIDGTEARTVASSRKLDYILKQLADILKDLRGRQR
jgi:hypothetical protein